MNAAIVTPEDDLTLLRAFATTRDETAFAAIAKRYGPMVLATARRQTRDPSRADDVAQAVFLILANKAASLDGRSLATGHPDAQPTRVARDLIAARAR